MTKLLLEPAGFFVVRTPRLPLALSRSLPQDPAGLDDKLSGWLHDSSWREALYLASPSLLVRAQEEYAANSQFSAKTRQALLKYLLRMSTRPTPFGLFATVGLGRLSERTAIEPGDWRLDKKVSRLDMEYLYSLRQSLTQQPALQQQLLYRFNPTFSLFDSVGHYIEPYHANGQQYRLSAVDASAELLKIRQWAQQPISLGQLAAALQQTLTDCDDAECHSFLQQLVQERLLLAELVIPLTAQSPEQVFVGQLPSAAQQTRNGLSTALQQLTQLDQLMPAPVAGYQAIWQQLQHLPCPVQENKLIQTDLFRPLIQSELDRQLITQLEQVFAALQVLQGPQSSPFEAFISQFQRRFEGQAVPLLALLNEETGISFSPDTGYDTPLLAGLQIRKSTRRATAAAVPAQAPLERLLQRQLLASSTAKVLQLDAAEILREQPDVAALWRQMPMSFACTVAVYEDEEHNNVMHLQGSYGPSGANLLGRFCHLDGDLLLQVRQYLQAEQALVPDVLLAEIVHSPGGRPGNVIARPQLRPDEIVFLADSGADAANQIALDDLLVYVEDNKVKLWSQSRQRQVLPRLSCAHNFSQRSLGIYRFLAMLGQQYGRMPQFTPPASWGQAKFTPRIMLGPVILAEASWVVPYPRLAGLVVAGQFDRTAWQSLQQEYQLDEWVSYAVADHVLSLQLTQLPMLQILLHECRGQSMVRLQELLSEQFRSVVGSAALQYANEFVLPWLNPHAALPVTIHPPATLAPQSRRLGPGSPWLSVKVYASASQAELLLDQLAPIFTRWQQQARIEGWFFIRYGDPDWHLRIRFLGEPQRLCLLLPELWQLLAPAVNSQQVQKLEVFTYEQELERYGGPVAIGIVEQIFIRDSQLACQTLQLIAQFGEPFRVRVQIAVVLSYLQAMLPEPASQLALISELREAFGREFQEHVQLRQQFGQRFRDYQQVLLADLQRRAEDPAAPSLYALLQDFGQQLQQQTSLLLALAASGQLTVSVQRLTGSLLHMSLNRLSKAYGREQELVVYDFCRRLLLARQQRKSND